MKWRMDSDEFGDYLVDDETFQEKLQEQQFASIMMVIVGWVAVVAGLTHFLSLNVMAVAFFATIAAWFRPAWFEGIAALALFGLAGYFGLVFLGIL